VVDLDSDDTRAKSSNCTSKLVASEVGAEAELSLAPQISSEKKSTSGLESEAVSLNNEVLGCDGGAVILTPAGGGSNIPPPELTPPAFGRGRFVADFFCDDFQM
jgi:hypothetical protein